MRIAYKNPNTYLVILVDSVLLYTSFWLAHWLRIESMDVGNVYLGYFHAMVFPVIVIKLVVFSLYGLQSGMWRYTSVVDLANIIKAACVSFAVIMVATFYYYYPDFTGKISRSVVIIDTIITIGLIGMFRLSIRFFYSNTPKSGLLKTILKPSRFFDRHKKGGIPALIFGAGERGEFLIRSLMSREGSAHHRYDIIGLISDNPRHEKVSIHGCPVLGGIGQVERTVERFGIKELLVAARVKGKKFEELYAICQRLHVTLRVVPPYLDGFHKKIDVASLRNIRIEDLLSRDPVSIDYTSIEKTFRDKKIMITGAGGSIGSQLALQLAEFCPSRLIFVDKGENYLHHLETGFDKIPHSIDLSFHCANITNKTKMNRLFDSFRPQFVFHAAAHKHVPMMERNIDEALRNNIGGMKVVSDLAKKFRVERFILISTDKAVNPGNVMGLTKRVCELYLQSLAQTCESTQYMAVRFGNVLGSNGSVVPLFMEQIENRYPVTVTDPDVERYFMTIPEAVMLILQSVTLGGQGRLFLLEMGDSVKIVDLAEKMIRMAGFEPEKDIEIIFTGLRPGEKVREQLVGVNEKIESTNHPAINMVNQDNAPWSGVDKIIETTLEMIDSDPQGACKNLMDWVNRSAS